MPFTGGSSPVTYTTTKLSYPIFDAEFDPYNRGYLLVAGGGAENRSGVPNRISLLDVSSRDALKVVTELDLSTGEDSPQSLASLTHEKGLITLVGISSSVADQRAGKNEHLRSFDVEFPATKTIKDETTETPARIVQCAKASLFSSPKSTNPQTYQRILRLSPVKSREISSKRIGAISSADGASNEIVLFDATTFAPTSASILQKLSLDSEAEDLDLLEESDGQFSLAFCDSYALYLYRLKCDFSRKTNVPLKADPTTIYETPTGPARPTMRCVRWLTDTHLAMLQNRPDKIAELVILEMDKDKEKCRMLEFRAFPKSMGSGARLAICQLDADPGSGERQIIIAVAGQSKSIHVLTLNHQPQHPLKLSSLNDFTVLDTADQHPQPIYKLAFSNFFPPKQPATATSSVASQTQYINLASVSSGYTVSVESFALTSTPTSPALTSKDPVAKSSATSTPSVRWVLSSRKSEFLRSWFGLYVAAFGILVMALLLQVFLRSGAFDSKATGGKSAVRSVSDFQGITSLSSLSSDVASTASTVSSVVGDLGSSASAAATSAVDEAQHKLRDLLHLHREHLAGDNPTKAILVEAPENPFSNGEVAARLQHDIDEARKHGAKRFDELSEQEKERWLRRLSETGHWAESIPSTLLKSVLFSQYSDIVGGAIRDAVLGS